METITSSAALASQPSATGQRHGGALSVVTTLFFMMGLITSLNDVLIPHLKAIYTLNYVQAMLVQFCFFGAYFIVSLPAGMLIKRVGYQNGVVAGFVLAAVGCALFYPASTGSYASFLFAFFVLAAGITILQVAANPYVTALGDARSASSRLTLTQAFNSLGTTIAPTLGGMLILSDAALATTVQLPYLALALLLLVLAIGFAFVPMPRITHAEAEAAPAGVAGPDSVFAHRHLVLGTIAIFVYVGGEVSIGSLLINFLGEDHVVGLAPAAAAHYVSYYWGGAMVGRFIGFAVMRRVSPGKALAFNAGCAILLILLAMAGHGPLAMWAIIAVGLCNSVMFPTIFSMAVNRLGRLTGQASGILCMAIVGGAVVPFLQGLLADAIGLRWSFVVPVVCYCYILGFGLKYVHMYRRP